ncbi:MAG: hypothetical protein JNJ58_05935 [Chitinophagaceae bacterium]|nr:hypothetical protein [Chitinophagaceae bacterium]
MSKKTFLIALFTFMMFGAYSQQLTRVNQPLFTGKYHLNVVQQIDDSIRSIQIKGDFSGSVKVQLTYTVTEKNGRVTQKTINRMTNRGNIELYASNMELQKLEINSFNIQYTEFGEKYALKWNDNLNQLILTKGDVNYNYAGSYNLGVTSFQWMPKLNAEPLDKHSEISYLSKD